ncbi:MAG: hypothetical protein F9K18_08475 [Thermoanaerobaculia bacterium]|nr:MAG: hypothetical protein F9K18_08475 [Thermoanaerobaculia bacterium]
MRLRRILFGGLAACAAASWGQVSPHGGEFQVNTETFGNQSAPAIAVDGQGGFVVAWQDWYYVLPGASDSDIRAQRFAPNGAPLGSEFEVNTDTTSPADSPAVTMSGDGAFVVVWNSITWPSPYSTVGSIRGRRYDAAGAPLGEPFQVNSSTTTWMGAPSVALAPSGRFVVAWEHYGSGGSDADGMSIQARLHDENGFPIGSQFQVNTYTTGRQVYAALGADIAGNFVVVWQSDGSSGTDTDGQSILAQRFDPAGVALGGEIQVNSYTTGSQWHPAVAVSGDGSFLVTWASSGSPGNDSDSGSVQARRFDSAGLPSGAQFQVNTYTTDTQWQPAAAVDGRGDFVIVWYSVGSSGGDTSYRSVQARRYRADGTALGDEFQVNTYTTGSQYRAVVAADGPGNFVVAWASYGSSFSDTDRYSVQGQRFDDLFRDGFESGGEDRWSVAVP